MKAEDSNQNVNSSSGVTWYTYLVAFDSSRPYEVEMCKSFHSYVISLEGFLIFHLTHDIKSLTVANMNTEHEQCLLKAFASCG